MAQRKNGYGCISAGDNDRDWLVRCPADNSDFASLLKEGKMACVEVAQNFMARLHPLLKPSSSNGIVMGTAITCRNNVLYGHSHHSNNLSPSGGKDDTLTQVTVKNSTVQRQQSPWELFPLL